MNELPVFHVILSLSTGKVHEVDLRAPDACSAAYLAGENVLGEMVTNVHARRVSDG